MNTSKIQKQYAAVIYLDYINRNTLNINSEYPTYMKEELHVQNSRVFVKSLMRNGFIAQQEQQLTLTKNGMNFLQQNQDYVRFFELGNLHLSIQEYIARKNIKSQMNFELVMIELLREKMEKCKAEDDYESVRDLHSDIAGLYESADYPLQALHHYMLALYLDVSGLEYYDILLRYMKGKCKKSTLMEKFDFIYFRPEIQAGIKRLKDSYDDEIVDWIYENNSISINLCNKKHFVSLVTDIMNDTFVETEWQKYFRQTLEKIVDMIDKKAKETDR